VSPLHEVHVIAVAADDDQGLGSPVAAHFGRCPFYVVAVTKGLTIRASRVVANPHVADHGPGSMLGFLRDLGANVVLVGKVGPAATHRLEDFGIEEVTARAVRVGDAVRLYLALAAQKDEAKNPSTSCGAVDHSAAKA
jgi:predicted Fe-Mo cluster-binding NifX family protein